ncbi:MAG: cytochrome c [Bacteroidota bacterium]
MRLFKFLLYSLGLLLGILFAFRKNAYQNPEERLMASALLLSTASEVVDEVASPSEPASPLFSRGKNLFKNNCASCHNRNMRDDMTGPALAGVQERWEGREAVLYNWIRNSAQVIASGDPYAVALYKKWDNSVMSAFPNLQEEDIDALLAYIDEVGNR